jgi:hypothetical protein
VCVCLYRRVHGPVQRPRSLEITFYRKHILHRKEHNLQRRVHGLVQRIQPTTRIYVYTYIRIYAYIRVFTYIRAAHSSTHSRSRAPASSRTFACPPPRRRPHAVRCRGARACVAGYAPSLLPDGGVMMAMTTLMEGVYTYIRVYGG